MDDENAHMCIKSINVNIFMCATDFRINRDNSLQKYYISVVFTLRFPCALAKCVKIKVSLFPPKMVYFSRSKDLPIKYVETSLPM